MRLFIAEKPSMGEEIAKVLGNPQRKDGYFEIGDDIVTWAFGHILRQLEPEEYEPKFKDWVEEDLPIFPLWKNKVSEDCKKQFLIIKGLINKADEIVHAGDPDREGQLLVDEIFDYVGCSDKPIKRILLNALDEGSIKKALSSLRENQDFVGLKNSAIARGRADWLTGINLTRVYTLAARRAGRGEVFHIGRVKTPTMALVVRREEEIQSFKPTKHYQVKAFWQYNSVEIPSIWQPDEQVPLDAENRLVDKNAADNLLKKIKTISGYKSAVVSKIETTTKKEPQRLPYSLSALQIEAGKRYGYEPQLVLATMQQLYEKKLTSYPRSDCDFLPESQLVNANQILSNLAKTFTETELAPKIANADQSIRSRCWNDKKISAHHAIIPTLAFCDASTLTEIQQNLYVMVSLAYIAQFYPVHSFDSTKLWIECSDEVFTATGKIIKELGWKTIYPHKEENEEDSQALPDITEGETLKYLSGEVVEKITTPPKRFNPATLLQAMKEIHKYVQNPEMKSQLKYVSGIGTEATRADIIKALMEKGFFSLEKKQLYPTEKAKIMVAVLPDMLTYPDTTAVWEEQLAQVEAQELSLTSFCEKQKNIIINLMEAVNKLKIETPESAVKCPECGGFLGLRQGKKGPFWGCLNYPKCKTIFQDRNGKPVITKTYPCPICKIGKLTKRQSVKGDFWGCNRFPTCKTVYGDKDGAPDIK